MSPWLVRTASHRIFIDHFEKMCSESLDKLNSKIFLSLNIHPLCSITESNFKADHFNFTQMKRKARKQDKTLIAFSIFTANFMFLQIIDIVF